MTETKVDHPEFGHVTFTNLTQRQLDIVEGYKERYSREDVASLIAKYWMDEISGGNILGKEGFSKWIKENLL